MKCPECGERVAKGRAVCSTCGASLRARIPMTRCRYCGAKVPKGVQVCPQCGRVPTLRRRVSILLVTILLGIALGVGAAVVSRNYLPDLRYRLGTLLIEESGMGGEQSPATATPTVIPTP